jgi:hypothetical protein
MPRKTIEEARAEVIAKVGQLKREAMAAFGSHNEHQADAHVDQALKIEQIAQTQLLAEHLGDLLDRMEATEALIKGKLREQERQAKAHRKAMDEYQEALRNGDFRVVNTPNGPVAVRTDRVDGGGE